MSRQRTWPSIRCDRCFEKTKKEFQKTTGDRRKYRYGSRCKSTGEAGADAVKVGSVPVPSAQPDRSRRRCSADHRHDGSCFCTETTGIPLIADGGIRYTGDMVKASQPEPSVMMGSVFAGTEESPGETIIYEGRKFKQYRGMGSMGAMTQGSSDRYFQDVEDEIKKLVPEGIEGRVAYKGNLSEVVQQYIGGLRAGMGYCGAKDIAALQTAQFIKITNAGMRKAMHMILRSPGKHPITAAESV